MDKIEKIDKSLEEAAREYVTTHLRNNEFPTADSAFKAGAKWQEERNKTLVKEAHDWGFGAGSEWQKQHDAELIEIAYNDGITIGMTKQKEQMLKDAVEGFIFQSAGYYPKELIARYDGELKHGDKVRIIIVKEDGK